MYLCFMCALQSRGLDIERNINYSAQRGLHMYLCFTCVLCSQEACTCQVIYTLLCSGVVKRLAHVSMLHVCSVVKSSLCHEVCVCSACTETSMLHSVYHNSFRTTQSNCNYAVTMAAPPTQFNMLMWLG